MMHRILIVSVILLMVGGDVTVAQNNRSPVEAESSPAPEVVQTWKEENLLFLGRLETQQFGELRERADLDLSYFSERTIYVYLDNNTRVEMFRADMLPNVLEYAPNKRELVFILMGKFVLYEMDDETFLRLVEQIESFFKQHGFQWIVFRLEFGFEPRLFREWGADGVFIDQDHPPTDSADLVLTPQEDGAIHVYYGDRYGRDATLIRAEDLDALLTTAPITKNLGVIYIPLQTLSWKPAQFQKTVELVKHSLEQHQFKRVIVYPYPHDLEMLLFPQ